jgi:hypothetical protein
MCGVRAVAVSLSISTMATPSKCCQRFSAPIEPPAPVSATSLAAAGCSSSARPASHLLHLGVVIVGAGTVVVALTVTGARAASTLDLAPGLFLFGVGAGISMGQVFYFILAGVGMDEVGSATGVVEAMQQLASAVGVAALATIFFSAFAGHLPTHALAITAWACLVQRF